MMWENQHLVITIKHSLGCRSAPRGQRKYLPDDNVACKVLGSGSNFNILSKMCLTSGSCKRQETEKRLNEGKVAYFCVRSKTEKEGNILHIFFNKCIT